MIDWHGNLAINKDGVKRYRISGIVRKRKLLRYVDRHSVFEKTFVNLVI